MKLYKLFMIIMISVSCELCSNTVDYSVLYGYWGFSMKDKLGDQHFIAYFYKDVNEINCEFHSYTNGMKFNSEPSGEISFDGTNLSMIVNQNADVKYEGKVDLIKSMINGKLIYSNGSEMEFNLTKYSVDKIKKEYPGLLHLKDKSYSYLQPETLNDGIQTSTLDEVNINGNILNEMVGKINNGDYGKVNSVLILRNGKLVFEKYFDGFCVNDLNMQRSATKSMSSLLTGIAIDKHLIKSVDQKLLDFYPDYQNKLPDEWNNVLLKHVLTMTMGLNWNDEYEENIWERSDDVIKSTFEQKFAFEPGTKFEYRNPNVDLLAGVLIKVSGEPVQKFADENLFKPLGIKNYQWRNFKKNNYPLMDGSLCLRPRDMAKIGLMILDNGKWNGNKIISQKWIEESTSPKIKVDDIMSYGYLWWLGKSKTKPGLKAVFANGLGGQHIIIVRDLSLVIVTTGGNFVKPAGFLLRMIDEYIIKSIN